MIKKKHLIRLLCIMLSLMLIAVLPSCSKKAEEPEPEPETEEPAEEVDYSLYADESLGIDGKVGAELRDYRTILIAGIDNNQQADIQLVFSINKETGEARMITVNRDTYMQLASGETVVTDGREVEFCKCNRAYEYGGKYELMKELNRHLDLNIKEFIGVDWPTAVKIVDLLGGVEVNIESQEMLDGINHLISVGSGGCPSDTPFIPGTGNQTLSGWQAVQYLRVRKYDGGNAFVRDDHNRAFIEALFAKAKSMKMEEIAEIYDEIAGDLETNMSRNTLTDTLAAMLDHEIKNIGRFPYEFKTRYEPPDKRFNYRVAQSLYSNVIQLHADMFDQTGYLPSSTVLELSDKIIELEENYLIKREK